MDQPASRPSRIPWPPILFIGAIGLGFALARVYPLPWPGTDDPLSKSIGYTFGLLGLGLFVWGIATLVRAGTNVLPDRAADRLVTSGAFRFRRHPIYLGETLMLLGLAELTDNIWFVLLAPVFAVAVLALAIVPEEQHLEERFGQEYLDYKARTRMWF